MIETSQLIVDSCILAVSLAQLYYIFYVSESVEDIEEDIDEELNGKDSV